MEKALKQYDKLLTHKKNLDGSVDILRQSPFDTQKEHKLFTITNQRLGHWVIKKLISMDTTRHDLVGKSIRHNLAIKNKQDSRNMHEELAELITLGGSTFIN